MNAQATRVRVTHREWLWVAVAAAIILFVAVALNVLGYLAAPPDHHFAGMVYAFEDGQTYLAKIRQGMQGAWLYTLAYSADPGPPFVLYTNYLFLGHVAAWVQVGPDILFHVARLFDGGLLLFTLYAFVARFFAGVSHRRFAFLLAAVGGGIGWLTVLLGHPTPDLLQPEMFPFLSIFANVHFPITMAALLWLCDLLVTDDTSNRWQVWTLLVLGTLILATMAPYGLITISAVSTLWIADQVWLQRRLPRMAIARLSCVVIIAASFFAFYSWSLDANPSFTSLNSQDRTTSPPPWDYLAAGGLLLIPAFVEIWVILRRGFASLLLHANDFLLIVWTLLTIILMYLPFISAQRRYSVALFVPLAILAVRGMDAIPFLRSSGSRFTLLVTSSLTNVLLLLVIFLAVEGHAPSLFFTQNEWGALSYLNANGMPHALVLTSPELGLFIPAWTGQRVIYGHPDETLGASARKLEVTHFYADKFGSVDAFLKPVDYVVIGPRERALGTPQLPPEFALVYSAGDVQVFARR